VRKPPPPLTAEEQEHLRVALVFLRARIGTWAMVAKVVRSKRANLRRVRAGNRIRGMRALARRVSRVVGVDASDVLSGRFLPSLTCSRCGYHEDGT
jgi:hypothetical protein